MSTPLTDLTKTQRAAFDEFKKKVADVLTPEHTDSYLLKWVRAKKFNVKKAETKFRQCLEWRKSLGVDDIFEKWTPPEVVREPLTTKFMTCFGKDGSPVTVSPVGKMDIKGLLRSVSEEDGLLLAIYRLESIRKAMKKQSETLGRDISQNIDIGDLEGLDFKIAASKKNREYIIQMSKIITNYYPEMFKKIIIINAPSFFPYVYGLVKPFISKSLQRVIEVYGPDRQKWVPALLAHVDADKFPKHWGGNLVDSDGDPCCPSKVYMGGEIPRTFYLANASNIQDSEFESKTLEKGQTLDMEYDVPIANSKLHWVYYLENVEDKIGFAVRHKTSGGVKDVVAYTREKRDLVVDSEFACTNTGTYVVNFDNTKGKRSVTLGFYAQVVLPNAGNEPN